MKPGICISVLVGAANKVLIVVLAGWLITAAVGCGGEITPALTDQQKAVKILTEGNPWGGPGKVEVLSLPEGVDPSGLSGLTFVFSGSGDPQWVPTGITANGADDFLSTDDGASWRWATPAGTNLITLEGASVLEFTSVDVQDAKFTFSFERSTVNARTRGLDGTYRLALSK